MLVLLLHYFVLHVLSAEQQDLASVVEEQLVVSVVRVEEGFRSHEQVLASDVGQAPVLEADIVVLVGEHIAADSVEEHSFVEACQSPEEVGMPAVAPEEGDSVALERGSRSLVVLSSVSTPNHDCSIL
jgi:hypothetical protein